MDRVRVQMIEIFNINVALFSQYRKQKKKNVALFSIKIRIDLNEREKWIKNEYLFFVAEKI